MSISLDEVRHIAALARLGISEESAGIIAVELNGILAHMQLLTGVDTSDVIGDSLWSPGKLPLRADKGPPIPLAAVPNDFAPAMREGLFLVPRLATHEDAAS